jgi:Tol biopolymer transport system component/predicted Ser/Thr protein kinase
VIGQELGPYHIVSKLGSGGMGDVWLATETSLGRKVALKLLPPDLTRDPSRVQRFEQEARAASGLNHPNVCTILALGRTADGQQYIAMEYVEGETLRHRLSTMRPSLLDSVEVAVQVAGALNAAHTAGIVHRDIKPENVMIRRDGFVKVLDFGLAKLAPAVAEGAADATRTVMKTDVGVVVGTVTYMSPEQAKGLEVDHRTDIWSLAVMLYEAVAGRSPFAASSSTEVLAAILDREPLPLTRFEPDTPAELQRILAKALRKDRNQRYQTVQDLLLDLQVLRDDLRALSRSGSGPVAQATGPAATSGSAAIAAVSPSRRVAIGVAAIVLLAAAAAAAWWWRTTPNRSATTQATAVQRSLTRLTFGQGLQTDVTFSPDGRFIAYASDRSGNFDIWVQPVAGGDAVQITKSPEPDTQPAWSPDGSTIAFRSERDGGSVFLVPALGGQERKLVSEGVYPRWSPDGSRVLLQSAAWWNAPDSIALTVVRPGEPAKPALTEFLKGGRFYWAGWHPDGRISVIGLHRTLGIGFFTMPAAGGTPVKSEAAPPVAKLLNNMGIVQFTWMPDGRHLILEGAQSAGLVNLWRMTVEGDGLTWSAAERLTTGATLDVGAARSPDGKLLAYTVARQAVGLYGYGLPRHGPLSGRATPLSPLDEQVLTSDVSADGRQLVYEAEQTGGQQVSRLWAQDLISGARESLSPDDARRRAPVWSPDGRMLAYQYFPPSRQGTTLAVRERNGRERFLSSPRTNGYVIPTHWTPDGRSVVASERKDGSLVSIGLWPVDRADQAAPQRTLLKHPTMNLWQGHVSPDGRWLTFVYIDTEGAMSGIAVAPSEGADPSRWIRLPGEMLLDKPRWAHDGRSLYCIGRRARSYFHLFRIGFDPAAGRFVGSPEQLSDFSRPDLEISPEVGSAELSVTATQVFLTMRSTSGSIWMLDNVDR